MKKLPILAISSSLLLPAVVVATPAEAAAGPVIVQNCAGKVDGVPVRIKMRFEMRSASDPNKIRLLRIRVSHPRGTGNFKERRLASTVTVVDWGHGSDAGAVGLWTKTSKPSLRLALGNTFSVLVRAKFKLRNGERERVRCYREFHGD